MPAADPTGWQNRSITVPGGLVMALVTLFAGTIGAGGTLAATRSFNLDDADSHALSVVVERIRRVEQLDTEHHAELIRRLDAMDRRIDRIEAGLATSSKP